MQLNQLSESDKEKLNEIYTTFLRKKMVPSLSKLINDEVTFTSSNTVELSLGDISKIVPETEFQENDVGIYISCEGDIKLGVLFHMPLGMAKQLAEKLVGINNSDDLSSEGKSSLAEIGNILAASFFNALNWEIGCKIISSVPGLAIDTAEALLESPIIENATSETFIHSYGKLECKNANFMIRASVFQDPLEAKKVINH